MSVRRAVYVTDTMADVRMIEGLAERCELTLLAPASLGDRLTTWWSPDLAAKVDTVLLDGGRGSFLVRGPRWLARHGHDYDVAFVLDNVTAALAANLGHRFGGPPTVLQVGRPTVEYVRCGLGPRPGPAAYLRLILARLLVRVNERMAAGIGAVSEYVAELARRHNPLTEAIPFYGVDVERFTPTPTRSEAREALELPDDGPIILYRSRLAPEKDPTTFLAAVDRLRREGRDVTAVYMGGEHARFAELADEAGVHVVARDARSRSELPLWYRAADICVQASKREGLALSPVEALACGVPVVASDVGGLPEVVDHGRCGILVRPHDPVGMADAIAGLLDDPELARELGRRGRQRVVERYSADSAFDAWLRLGDAAAGWARRHPASGGHPPSVPVRVLFIDHETRLSGGQRDLVDLVRGFPEGAVEVHVALPGEGPLADALRHHGAQVHIVPMDESFRRLSRGALAERPWRLLRLVLPATQATAKLVRLARRLRPDVVHTNSMKAHAVGAIAARAARAPLVWHVRDILPENWVRSAFTTAAGVVPDRVVSLSHVAARPFEGGRSARRIRVVHNGIRPLPVSDDEVAAWRRKLGAENGDPLVGMVGQIAHWKGQDVFVEAAARLHELEKPCRFALVGSCLFPENEREFDEGIRRRAHERGLDDCLVWIDHAEPIEPLMAALDVLVHASRLPEPFGRVLVEAMAQGTPVVTTEVGAGPEIVPSSAGVHVPPGDPVALSDALIDLIDDEETREAFARSARRTADGFDITATADGVVDIYRELIHHPSLHPGPPS